MTGAASKLSFFNLILLSFVNNLKSYEKEGLNC